MFTCPHKAELITYWCKRHSSQVQGNCTLRGESSRKARPQALKLHMLLGHGSLLGGAASTTNWQRRWGWLVDSDDSIVRLRTGLATTSWSRSLATTLLYSLRGFGPLRSFTIRCCTSFHQLVKYIISVIELSGVGTG